MKLICGIWPFDMEVKRPTFIPENAWTLKGAGPDEVSMLQVHGQSEMDYAGHDRWFSRNDATTDERVAADLCNEFRSGKSVENQGPGAGPGIWIHSNPNATRAEVLASPEYAAARQEMNILANAYVEEGNKLFETRHIPDITRTHRAFAKYLRMDGLAWVNMIKREDNQPCRFCFRPAPAAAIKCPYCSSVLDVKRYAQEMQELEAALASYGVNTSHREEINDMPVQPRPPVPVQAVQSLRAK